LGVGQHAAVGVVAGGLADGAPLFDVAAAERFEGAHEALTDAGGPDDDAPDDAQILGDPEALDLVAGGDDQRLGLLGAGAVGVSGDFIHGGSR